MYMTTMFLLISNKHCLLQQRAHHQHNGPNYIVKVYTGKLNLNPENSLDQCDMINHLSYQCVMKMILRKPYQIIKI